MLCEMVRDYVFVTVSSRRIEVIIFSPIITPHTSPNLWSNRITEKSREQEKEAKYKREERKRKRKREEEDKKIKGKKREDKKIQQKYWFFGG